MSRNSKDLIVGGLSQWFSAGLQLIELSLGLSFKETGTTVRDMGFTFKEQSGDNIATTYHWPDRYGNATQLIIAVNMERYANMDEYDANGKANGVGYLDRVLAHELTHAVMAANIRHFSELPGFIKEGAAELVHGIDDERYGSLSRINASDFAARINDDYDYGHYTVGYSWFRLLAFQTQKYTGKSQQQTIRDFMHSLDENTSASSTEEMLNKAVYDATGGLLSSYRAVTDFYYDRLRSYRMTTDFLRNECGIILGNKDTGAITGEDAGGTLKTAESVVSETGGIGYMTRTVYSFGQMFDMGRRLPRNIEDAYREYKGDQIESFYMGQSYMETEGLRVHVAAEYLMQKMHTEAGTLLAGSYYCGQKVAADMCDAGSVSLWGGSIGADTLYGSGSKHTEFFFGDGDGNDVIVDGNWGQGGDVLHLNLASGMAGYSTDGRNDVLRLNSGETLTIYGANGRTIRCANGGGDYDVKLAQAGSTVFYEQGVESYLAGRGSTLKVNQDGASVWMNGGYDGISRVDASGNNGSVLLAGRGDVSQTLVAGRGRSSLWGGMGSGNDTLQGNRDGSTIFGFGFGNGSDRIVDSTTNDKVWFYDANVRDFTAVDDTSERGVLKFSLGDGSTLRVNVSSGSVNTFQAADGTIGRYTYRAGGGSWSVG